MKIGFDLDGVLFEPIEFNGDLPAYNRQVESPKVKLNINRILNNTRHEVYIITGRSIDIADITRKTVKDAFPNFDTAKIIMANNYHSGQIDKVFRYSDYRYYIACQKFEWLKKLRLNYYFEDNPIIIDLLHGWQRQQKTDCLVVDIRCKVFVGELIDSLSW